MFVNDIYCKRACGADEPVTREGRLIVAPLLFLIYVLYMYFLTSTQKTASVFLSPLRCLSFAIYIVKYPQALNLFQSLGPPLTLLLHLKQPLFL